MYKANMAAMVFVWLSIACALLLARVGLCHEEPADLSGGAGLLRTEKDSPFRVPGHLDVGLVGLAGNSGYGARIDRQTLQNTLSSSLGSHRPSCLETGAPANTVYDLEYDVKHAGEDLVRALENVISHHLRFAGIHNQQLVYDVEAVLLEPYFDELHRAMFGPEPPVSGDDRVVFEDHPQQHVPRPPAERGPRDVEVLGGAPDDGQAASPDQRPAQSARADGAIDATPTVPLDPAVLVLNLDKARMTPPKPMLGDSSHPLPPELANITDFAYRYRYNTGSPTQTWVSRSRYVVVDLSAGPCMFGVTTAGEGTVSSETVPSPADLVAPADLRESAREEHERNSALRFTTQLVSLVVSAARHVFWPDVRYRRSDYTEKVVVPVIVLRNHDRFNPLLQGGSTTTLHAGEVGPVNDFSIDVDLLHRQVSRLLLPHQELVLTTGLRDVHETRQVSAAVFRSVRGDSIHAAAPDGRYTTRVVHYLDSAVLAEELRRSGDLLVAGLSSPVATASNVDAGQQAGDRSRGHRVLPVYVFSLLGLPAGTLFDQRDLVVADQNAVMVLQTGNRAVFLPFFSDDGPMFAEPRSPTRHIVAGLAAALGGIVEPYRRVARPGQVLQDYVWACGAHPFGVFSRSLAVSQSMLDTLRRNTVTARTETALETVRAASRRLESFTEQFVADAFGEELSAFEVSTMFGFLDSTLPQTALASDVASRLSSQLERLEGQFEQLSVLLSQHKMDAADEASSSLLVQAEGFSAYAEEELRNARQELRCCRKVHRRRADRATRNFVVGAALAVGLALFVVVGRLWYGPSRRRPGVGGLASTAGGGSYDEDDLRRKRY